MTECSAVGSARRSGRRGRRFESCHSDHFYRCRLPLRVACDNPIQTPLIEGYLTLFKSTLWVRVFATCLCFGVLLRLLLLVTSGGYFSQLPLHVTFRGLVLGVFYDSVVVGTSLLVLMIATEFLRLVNSARICSSFAKISSIVFMSLFILGGVVDTILFHYLNTKMRLSLILNNAHQLAPIVLTVLNGSSWIHLTLGAISPLFLLFILRRFRKNLKNIFTLEIVPVKARVMNFLFLFFVSMVWLNEPLWRLHAVASQPEAAQAMGSSGVYVTGSDVVNTVLRGVSYQRMVPLDQTSKLFDKYFDSNPGRKEGYENRITAAKNPTRPNVVIILMEYMGAFLSKELTPDGPGITPNLDELAAESIFFTQAFASSTRTHHGFVSVISGFPSILDTSVINKRSGLKIPTIATALPDYDSTFLYSGDIGFDGMDSFAIQGDFKNLIADKQLLEKNPDWLTKRNDWGYPDELVFDYLDKHLEVRHREKIPSLTVVLTTSNHEPFQLSEDFYSKNPNLKRGSVEAGGAYADSMIGKFFAKAKTSPYYKDTIFILVADHSRMRTPSDESLKGFHIPLLIHSPRLAGHSQKVTDTAKQVDIPATIMGLLGRSFPPFNRFGRDLLLFGHKSPAFSVSRDGKNFVYKQDEFAVRFNIDTGVTQYLKVDQHGKAEVFENSELTNSEPLSSYPEKAKVYLQRVYDVFQGLN